LIDSAQHLKTSDFSYDLPEELVAQRPVDDRDHSRLLYLNKAGKKISHHVFNELTNLLRPGDRLVFNDTRVIPARMFCIKPTGTKVELLFTKRLSNTVWNVIALPGKRLKKDMMFSVEKKPEIRMKVLEVLPDGSRIISLLDNAIAGNFDEVIQGYGQIPLPYYIQRDADSLDITRYQTVYAKNPGAVAAPTAGLHFTQPLIDTLQKRGVDCSFVTLHVGIGTFRPVKEEYPEKHQMHHEYYEISNKTVNEINTTRKSNGRIIAVGTTVVRVLEHCARETGVLSAGSGSTNLFILPGFDFKVIHGMITNFHLPQSTLLMLVSAFAGRETVLGAYHAAISERYRFFSYGDAMLIL
jgi:S-adenosylmethionine:tRNA ribosyltransferase-isomerase